MSIYDKSSLVLIPSGTKTGKVYSQKPVSGDGDFTFTRASAATRVNADGNIEKETQNLLTGSNNLDNTSYWPHTSIQSVTGGQAGYDGSNDAFKIVENTANNQHAIQQNALSVGSVQCVSVYAKAAERDWLMLNQAGIRRTYYDLANGVMGSIDSGVIDATITSVGNGWYRCTYTADMGYTALRIGLTTGNGINKHIGDGSSGIYIQDAQLEQGLVARDYIETTTAAVYGGITDNTPRLDYTDSSCPSLLLEGSRTNSDFNSEYLANKHIVTNVSVTTNSTISPEGVVNASTITNNTTSGQHQLTDNTFSVTSGTDYTISLFLKYNRAQYVRLQFGGVPFGSKKWQNFDVLNGTKGSSGVGITSADASIEDYGNGWYRCIVTADAIANGSDGAFQIRILEDDNTSDVPSFAGTGLSTYAWGSQFEAGSYPTSYIPTYGSSVTRVGDAIDLSTLPTLENNFSLHFKFIVKSDEVSERLYFYSDSVTGGQIQFFVLNSRKTRMFHKGLSSESTTSLTDNNITAVGDTYNFVLTIAPNSIKFFANGALIGENTIKVPTAIDSIVDFEKSQGLLMHGLYPTTLTDAEAIALTTI